MEKTFLLDIFEFEMGSLCRWKWLAYHHSAIDSPTA